MHSYPFQHTILIHDSTLKRVHGHHQKQYQTNAVAMKYFSQSTRNSPRDTSTPSPAPLSVIAYKDGKSTKTSLTSSLHKEKTPKKTTRDSHHSYSCPNGPLTYFMNSSTSFRDSVNLEQGYSQMLPNMVQVAYPRARTLPIIPLITSMYWPRTRMLGRSKKYCFT